MRYLVRSIKYFFYFSFLATLMVVALIAVGAVEGNIDNIFNGGWTAVGKMAMIFALFAAIYPKVGFITKEVMVEGSLEDLREEITEFFREHSYIPDTGDDQMMAFRQRGFGKRLSRMGEDRIIIRQSPQGLTMEGLRKDVMRLCAGIEQHYHKL